MKLFFLVAALAAAWAQTRDTFPRTITVGPVAGLPSTVPANSIAFVSDGLNSTDCTSGGGSSRVLCVYTGSAWSALGGGGATSVSGLTDLKVTATSTTVLTIAAGTARFGNTPFTISAATATITAGSGSGTARVFLTSAGAIVVEHPTAAGVTITCSGCTQSQVTTPAVPTTAIPLADVALSSGTWSTVTDSRALSASKPLVAGTGISISDTLGEATVAIDTAEVVRTSSTNTLTGTYDVGGGVLEVPNGTSLPGTCSVGQVFMDTDATSGQRIYACESSNTWVLQGGGGSGNGYTLSFFGNTQSSPADATTYYFGNAPAAAIDTNATWYRIYVPKTGTIKEVRGNLHTGGTSGSSESSSIYVRINNTTDLTITTSLTTNSVSNPFSATGLSQAVTAGDYLEIKWVTPTWTTNPTNIRGSAVVYIE